MKKKIGDNMKLILNTNDPIFIQIARFIEDEIMIGDIEEETQIPSTTEISKLYTINPATVLKGINVLVDQGILYKKRGIGMFVVEGARLIIKDERKETFRKVVLEDLIKEANKLGISKQEIIEQLLECEGLE